MKKTILNNKGFTLIELLASITILAIISLMAVPNVLGSIQRSKNKTYIEDAKKLVSIAEYKVRLDDKYKTPYVSFCFNLDSLGANSLGTNKDTYDNDYSYVKVTRGCDGFTYSVQLAKKDTNKIGVVETSSKNLYEDNYASLIKTGNENFKLCDNSSPKTEVNVGEINKNILSAYVYNESSCITGDEQSCVETTCYKNKSVGSCIPGTIIKYKVNPCEIYYFYVLHDDGDIITMQQRENTSGITAWYLPSLDNTKGPLTALNTVEVATRGWINVNTINYKMGTTAFIGTNAYTGCTATTTTNARCDTNIYTLDEVSAKARLITAQEAMAVGCSWGYRTCPIWMYNYLHEAPIYGGTEFVDRIWSYWTMNADSGREGEAVVVGGRGSFAHYGSNQLGNYSGGDGIRAVVVISK